MNAFLILFSSLVFKSQFAYSTENLSANEVIKEHCQWEFDINQDINRRGELVFYTQAAIKKRKKFVSHWAPIHYVDWISDPKVVISSYNIESVKSEGEKQVATIKYHSIGHSPKAFIFLVDKPHDELVQLVLKKISNQWRVIDPPDELHVSKDAVLIQTRNELASIEELLKNPKNIPYQSRSLKIIKKAVGDIEKMNP